MAGSKANTAATKAKLCIRLEYTVTVLQSYCMHIATPGSYTHDPVLFPIASHLQLTGNRSSTESSNKTHYPIVRVNLTAHDPHNT